MVENDAGDTPWLLKGDGHLGSSQTLPVMRRAVKQSVDNILSPEILVSHADQGPQSGSVHSAQLAKVWKHVPRPTSAGRAQVIAAMTTYTDLNSSTLLNAAAAIIEKQAVFLANELRARKVLVHEDGDHVWNDTTGRYEPRR
jgi:hypothetical protein